MSEPASLPSPGTQLLRYSAIAAVILLLGLLVLLPVVFEAPLWAANCERIVSHEVWEFAVATVFAPRKWLKENHPAVMRLNDHLWDLFYHRYPKYDPKLW